jgi:hypothetical protein
MNDGSEHAADDGFAVYFRVESDGAADSTHGIGCPFSLDCNGSKGAESDEYPE